MSVRQSSWQFVVSWFRSDNDGVFDVGELLRISGFEISYLCCLPVVGDRVPLGFNLWRMYIEFTQSWRTGVVVGQLSNIMTSPIVTPVLACDRVSARHRVVSRVKSDPPVSVVDPAQWCVIEVGTFTVDSSRYKRRLRRGIGCEGGVMDGSSSVGGNNTDLSEWCARTSTPSTLVGSDSVVDDSVGSFVKSKYVQRKEREMVHLRTLISDHGFRTEKDFMDREPGLWSVYSREIPRLLSNYAPVDTERRRVVVHLYIGDSRCGKSERARMEACYFGSGGVSYDDETCVHTVTDADYRSEGTLWFPGYTVRKRALIISDYDGQSIKFEYLKQMCDNCQMDAPGKGTHCPARWEEIWITTNEPLSSWRNGKGRLLTPKQMTQLRERIHHVLEFRSVDPERPNWLTTRLTVPFDPVWGCEWDRRSGPVRSRIDRVGCRIASAIAFCLEMLPVSVIRDPCRVDFLLDACVRYAYVRFDEAAEFGDLMQRFNALFGDCVVLPSFYRSASYVTWSPVDPIDDRGFE